MSSSYNSENLNPKNPNLEFELENEMQRKALKSLAELYIEEEKKEAFYGILGLWYNWGKGDKSPEIVNNKLKIIMDEMNENELLEYAYYIVDNVDNFYY